MKSFHDFVQAWDGKPGMRAGRAAFFAVVLLAVLLGAGLAAYAQAVPAADAGGMKMSAGGAISGYELGYGQLKVVGATVFVDFDTMRHFGVEGEARWSDFHLPSDQKGPGADETASTYMAGLRYSRYVGRFQPYAKALVGFGQFNFPYNYATQPGQLVVAPGGGTDFRLTRRVRWRVVDFEYQFWPQFQYGLMSSVGVSTGVRVKIF
jgi:hypothetical protein